MRRIMVACAVVAGGTLAGCRAEEQGRPLILDKGTYEGPKDAALTGKQVKELDRRVMLQGTADTVSAGPASVEEIKKVPTTAAKPPAESTPIPESALSNRLRLQSGN